MYLKNITLRGFKSFANKSQLVFEPGISVIVGPNGSGKSNIADAVSWVLGEQSPKSLRGSSMGDVIFRSKKEELGVAEVSLVFDNSDRFLPVEFREVKFTRRVYMKGGSEYFINSSPCRLIDIQEMLADYGIGKGLYAIVNQGQINEITLLKPLERKIVIEEVLGISKHKIRRDRSINRLIKVKEDIGRIDDLVHEVKRTMDPLKVEAEKAKKYFEVSNALKKEEISFFLAHINNLNCKWKVEDKAEHGYKRKLDEVASKMKAALKEKEEYEKLIYKTRMEFGYWDKMVKNFNSEEAKLNNIISLAEGERSMFNTLYNMLDSSFYKSSYKKLEADNLKNNKDSRNCSFLQSLFFKLNKIRDMLNRILEKIKSLNSNDKTIVEIENDGKLVKEELDGLFEVIDDYNLENKAKHSPVSLIDDADEDLAENFSNVKKIEDIKYFCKLNYERSDKLLLVLSNLLMISKEVKSRLYPEFNKIHNMIEEKRERLDKLNNLVNDLNMAKADIERKLDKIIFEKEQIREKVKDITSRMVDTYNLSVDYIFKDYKPSEDLEKSEIMINKLKKELKKYGNVNPNAGIEYARIKKRFDFLTSQRIDLTESKENLEHLIENINEKIKENFMERFEQINKNFKYYFKILFPLGEGELQLIRKDDGDYDNIGIDLKVDIGNNKFVPLSLLSGGEKSLVSIAFLFSVFSSKNLPFYVFDEVDASLDDINLARFLLLVKKFAEKQQIILITHQKRTMEIADTIYGVSMQSDGVSKIISEKVGNNYAKAN